MSNSNEKIKIKHWCSQEFQEQVLPLMNAEELINYKSIVLDKDMWDSTIQKTISNTPLTPNELLVIINSIQQYADSTYVCHVKLKDEVVAVTIRKDKPEQDTHDIEVYELDYYDKWPKGNVFIYPANSKISEELTMTSFIEELEALIKKYSNI